MPKAMFDPAIFDPAIFDTKISRFQTGIDSHEKQFNASADLTLYRRNADGTYMSFTVPGSIQPGGSNLAGIGLSGSAQYSYSLFTEDTVMDGDRVQDVDGNLYDVHVVKAHYNFNIFSHFEAELFRLQAATLKTRTSSSAYTYTDTALYMNFGLRGQSSLNPQEYYGYYDYVGVTSAAVYEGDQIADEHGVVYEVMQVSETPGNRLDYAFAWRILVLVKKFSAATLRTLTLGDADSTTGLYAVSYASSIIYVQVMQAGKSSIKTPAGYYGKYDYVGLTSASVLEGDQLTLSGVTYEVMQVSSYPTARTDIALTWKVIGLTKRDFADQPATSGTWHLDSESVKTDPRNRIRESITTYYTAGNVKLDNNSTNATTHTCFDGLVAPITRIFTTKDLDVLAVISRGTSNTLYTDWVFGHKPYAFEEEVIIDIYTINKSDVTATRLVEAYEQEIRRIFTTYDAYSTVKDLNTITPEKTDLGYTYLHHTAVNIKYKRANDNYSPTYPTITWGPSATPTGTYTFPNVTRFQYRDPNTGEIRLLPAGRQGEIIQILGNPDFEIILTCDMSVQPAAKTWKRAQSGSKTDAKEWQIIDEIKFTGTNDSTKLYQTFNFGGGTTIPVRVGEPSIDGETLVVPLKRYSATNQSSSTYSAYHGFG